MNDYDLFIKASKALQEAVLAYNEAAKNFAIRVVKGEKHADRVAAYEAGVQAGLKSKYSFRHMVYQLTGETGISEVAAYGPHSESEAIDMLLKDARKHIRVCAGVLGRPTTYTLCFNKVNFLSTTTFVSTDASLPFNPRSLQHCMVRSPA